MAKPYLTTPPLTDRLPRGIKYIVGNEAAERFSFYGMKTILYVYMTSHLLDAYGNPDPMSDPTAVAWVHHFTTAVYFFPILGAIISDWLLGKYRTIISLSLVYCAGHAVLATIELHTGVIPPRAILLLGLALIAIGAGGIKPCVSAHVGDQFGEKNKHLLSRIFGWFYFSINLGSTFSTLLTPVLLEYLGPAWAFGVPGVLMALATLVFWLGRNVFVHVPPSGERFFEETFSREGRTALLNLVPLYIFVAMFWSLFDQTSSKWVGQAEHMNRVIVESGAIGDYGAWELLPSQMQAVNPILVMILIPIFSYGVYPLLGRWFEVTPLRKISIGLFCTIPAFLIPGLVEVWINAGYTPHIVWHIFAYAFITAAEVMVSITTLEFSYTQAPKRMKSFIMGAFLLSVALGNQFTAQVNEFIAAREEEGLHVLEGANYYWFFAGAMLVTAVLFVPFTRFYRGRTYIQGQD